jgi:hypothetical protein
VIPRGWFFFAEMAGIREDGTNAFFEPTLKCYAGAAKLDITPPVGIYTRMWGAALHDCATMVHRPLFASALCLAESTTAAPRLLLTVDLCVMAFEETEEVIAAVSKALGIADRHQIVFTMSHTHAGAGILSRDDAFTSLPGGHLIAPYVDTVIDGCVKVATAARDALEPAWLTTGRGSCQLACNRDTWDAKTTATAPPGAGTSVQVRNSSFFFFS